MRAYHTPSSPFCNMFCVECGKEGKTYRGLCLDCYLKKRVFFRIPSEITVTFCRNCDAHRILNQWKTGDMWADIEDAIKSRITAEIPLECSFDREKGTVTCRGTFEGRKIEKTDHIKIKEKYRLCPKCSLQRGGYFEAILQVRGAKEEQLERIGEIIKRKVDDQHSFITKKEKVRGGTDYYMGARGAAEQAAKEIREKFGGKLTISSSLVGVKDGKRVYRDTYSVRLPEYIGSFFKLDNKLYRVVAAGRKLQLEGMDGETRYIYEKELKRAVKVELEAREATVLHHDKNTLYIMDSLDFTTKEVAKPKGWREGKKIKIVEYEGNIYAFEYHEENHIL